MNGWREGMEGNKVWKTVRKKWKEVGKEVVKWRSKGRGEGVEVRDQGRRFIHEGDPRSDRKEPSKKTESEQTY